MTHWYIQTDPSDFECKGDKLSSSGNIMVTPNDRHGVSNYRSTECLFNDLLRLTTKKHQRSKLLSLCEGNPHVTDLFPAQKDSIAENVSIWWRHGETRTPPERLRHLPASRPNAQSHPMMTSLNGTIFGVTGTLCGDFTGHRWIPHTKASDAELWCFLWYAPE